MVLPLFVNRCVPESWNLVAPVDKQFKQLAYALETRALGQDCPLEVHGYRDVMLGSVRERRKVWRVESVTTRAACSRDGDVLVDDM